MVKNLIRLLHRGNKLSQFLVLFSFLVTFVIARVIVTLERFYNLANPMSALHIHHLVPGIILILISGYLSISFYENKSLRETNAILFGIGAALTIDEFALWLFLQDVYWAKQGRVSVDAVIITLTIFTLVYVISKADNHRWIRKKLPY